MRPSYQLPQLRRILGTAALRFRKYELFSVGAQNADHFCKLLVGHRPEDDPDTLGMELSKKGGKRIRRSNIVGTVEKKTTEPFQSSGPCGRVDASDNVF